MLLHLMHTVQAQLDAPVHAIHIQHGLQAEADQWAQHCANICQQLGIPLAIRHLNLQPEAGVSLEAMARDARYAAIAETLPDNGMLLTAHHADDQAETLLLQMFRGAGIDGLASMPTCRAWRQGWHARPLLSFPQTELQAYAAKHQLQWIEDPSNQNTQHDRNYLRHEIMPLLRKRWPGIPKTLSRSASHIAATLPNIHTQAEEALQQCLNPQGSLSIHALKKRDENLRAWVIRTWVRQNGHATPRQAHLAQIEQNLLNTAPDASPQVSWGEGVLRRYRDELWLTARRKPPPPQTTLAWPDIAKLTLPAGCGHLARQPDEHQGIPDRLWRNGKIRIGWRTEGIMCQPAGRQGHRTFKKLCQEFHIPPWRRPYLPLIYVDERLIAIADYCLCGEIEILPGDTLSRLVYQPS